MPATLPSFRRSTTVTAAVVALIAVATLACRATPTPAARQAPTVDPTGQYTLAFSDDGRIRGATMIVEGTPGSYAGRIAAENRPEVAISALAASGPQVIATADIPQGVLLVRFRVAGDSIRGDWSLRGEGGRLTGVRHKAGSK